MFHWLKSALHKPNSLIGLDIGTAAIKLVQLNFKERGYQLTHYATAPLPVGAVIGKEIKDSGAVSRTLAQAFADVPIACKNVAIAIPDNQVISKIIQLEAGLTASEIETHVMFEVDKHIPYPLADINIDFQVQGSSVQHPEMIDVLLIAARKNTCDARIDAIHAAGLMVKVVDVESYAIERATSRLNYLDQQQLIAVLDIGAAMMTFNVFRAGHCVFTRSEPVMQTESHDIELVLSKLQRILQFFFSTHQHDEVKQLFLAGGVALQPDFANRIAQALKIEVTLANPFVAMQLSDDVNKEALDQIAPSMLLSCGLALHSFVA